jgi:hypothetical protein
MSGWNESARNTNLLAENYKLKAEIKRLRTKLDKVREWADNCPYPHITSEIKKLLDRM